MAATAFPTEFPSDAAAKIGQAILAKTFTVDLIEPIYTLIGFGLGKLFGSGSPFPKPTFGAGIEPDLTHDQVGDILMAASDGCSVQHEGKPVYGALDTKALPWKSIVSVLFTILQGLLLAEQPPIVNPAKP